MNVVIVDGDVSFPLTSGKRLRTYHLMTQLARRHQILYFGRGQGDLATSQRAREQLASQGVEAHIIEDPLPRKKGLAFYSRLGANLFSPLPYSVTSHQSDLYRRTIAHATQGRAIDLWQLEWAGYLSALPAPDLPVVLQAHNVDTLIWRRYHEAEKNPFKRWYIRQQWQKFLRFEQIAFRQAKRVVCVSAEDASLAKEWFGIDHLDVVDNGVEVQALQDVRPDLESRCILYLGSLDWRPNLDALDVLLDAIFPAVRARLADARLVIVGRSPPDRLRQRVLKSPGVQLHADVAEIKPYLQQSAVMAVPLRIGGGSRLKILESLAAGLPVVSTRVGAEGLTLKPGLDYTLADTPEQMVDALCQSLTQPERARQQAEHGRKTVAAGYDWASLATRLERIWEKARA